MCFLQVILGCFNVKLFFGRLKLEKACIFKLDKKVSVLPVKTVGRGNCVAPVVSVYKLDH